MTAHTTTHTLHPARPDLGPVGPAGTAWMRVPYVVRHASDIPAAELNEWTTRMTANGHDDPDVQDLWAVSGDLLALYRSGATSVGVHCASCDITNTQEEAA
ncbi:hypothetical protein [Micrococcus lylae]|uniref:hypothetical protein n=1 Tax=Micrococcus lylae TaxID=1273 RepID=UPI000C8062E9|nr:hypothetical protein [Micrococcus lylae]WIK82126.1 hypothetical protein CJ228_011160 [Micrococcus lylae]